MENNWTYERCIQLENMQRILRIVSEANSANNFLNKMQTASELANELLNSNESFVNFLINLAIKERESQK